MTRRDAASTVARYKNNTPLSTSTSTSTFFKTRTPLSTSTSTSTFFKRPPLSTYFLHLFSFIPLLALATAHAAPVATSTLSAKAYVQNGLIGCYDGIENCAWGQHDSSATSWTDLTGNVQPWTGVSGKAWCSTLTYEIQGAVNGTHSAWMNGSLPVYKTLEIGLRWDEGQQVLAQRSTPSDSYQRIFILNWGDGTFGANRTFYGKDASVKTGSTNFFAAVYGGDGTAPTKYYLGGTGVTTTVSKTYGWALGSYPALGSRYNVTDCNFRGGLYVMRLYNRALTADEVAWNNMIDRHRFFDSPLEEGRIAPDRKIAGGVVTLLSVFAAEPNGKVSVGGTSVSSTNVWSSLGSTVTVVPVPDEGYRFYCWKGDVNGATIASDGTMSFSAGPVAAVNATCYFRSEGSSGLERTWTGSAGDGLWETAGNWSPEGVPAADDDVTIGSGASVLVAAATAKMMCLNVAGTLTFTNWLTCVNTDTVTIPSGGKLTCAGPYTTAQMSNRVWVACRNLSLASGASINVNGKGWRAATTSGSSSAHNYGWGPGGGDFDGGGAAHGGTAGHGWGKTHTVNPKCYGSVTEPTNPGSGGGAGSGACDQSHGGGAVRIDATGHVQIGGTITADGVQGDANHRGSGSGGSVLVVCKTLDGSGTVSACGGAPSNTTRGGGGGGRIALRYDTAAQTASGYAPKPVLLCADGRAAGSLNMADDYPYGGVGSVCLSDNSFFPGETAYWSKCAGEFFIPGWTSLSLASLDLAKIRDIRFHDLTVEVAGDMAVRDTARLFLTNCTLKVGGSLTVSNTQFNVEGWSDVSVKRDLNVGANGQFIVTGGSTNGSPWTEYTAQVKVGRTFRVQGTSAKYRPTAEKKTGGGVFASARDFIVATNAMVDAKSRGWRGITSSSTDYTWGYGPGTARYTAGASYGAMGGQPGSYTYPNYLRGPYGDVKRPTKPGSDAGKHWGGYVGGWGGGLVWIETRRYIDVIGKIDADGGACTANEGGGGSGGGILLSCLRLRGGGSITARGGGCKNGGSGSGGRIAIYSLHNDFTGLVSATNGVCSYTTTAVWHGKPGTIYYGAPPQGMMVIVK